MYSSENKKENLRENAAMATCIHLLPTWCYLCINVTKLKIFSKIFSDDFLKQTRRKKKKRRKKINLAVVNSTLQGKTHLRNWNKKISVMFLLLFHLNNLI